MLMFFNIIGRGRYFIIPVFTLLLITCSEDPLIYEPDAISEEYYKIAAEKDTNSLHFFLISDWGYNGSQHQQIVAGSMEQLSREVGLDFIVTCGDNFQYEGVDSKHDRLWKENFEDVYHDSSLMVNWYPALGNHDHRGNTLAQVEYSALSDQWTMPGQYYTFTRRIDTTTIRFIVIDTHSLIGDYRNSDDQTSYSQTEQYLWFSGVLRNATEKWILVIGHHPVYSSGGHGDTEDLKVMIKPLLDQYQVDFYICGHDHHFEHIRENFTDYIVTGTGGSVRTAGHNSRTVFSISRLGFTYISLSGEKAKLYFISDNAQTAYYFEKTK
jgi:tartrate-resistant acid phosphatase type 5